MKVEVLKTLRSPELTQDIGDVIELDNKVALKLIEAGALKKIEEAQKVEVTALGEIESSFVASLEVLENVESDDLKDDKEDDSVNELKANKNKRRE